MAGMFGELFRRVIQHGIDQGAIPKMSTETKVTEGFKWVAVARKFLVAIGLKEATAVDDEGNVKSSRSVPTRTDVAIEWPSLLHKNQLEDAQTMQIHQSMGLASRQTLRGKTGYDHEVEMERLAEEKQQDQDEFEQQRQAELDIATAAGGDGDPQTPPKGSPTTPGKKVKGEGPGGKGVGKP